MFKKIVRFFGIKQNRSADFKAHRVLVVDDNEADLLLIKKTIEKAGHEVLTAENGRVGLQLAKDHKPDLILSDCKMPQMDGVQMCVQLKEIEETKDIPFVFLTGVEAPKNVIECFELGADNYICKPIQPRLLIHQIKTIFSECLA